MKKKLQTSVFAAYKWPSNAELIADAAKLGYIGDNCLDLTYGFGVFWKEFCPPNLVTSDLVRDRGVHTYSVFDPLPEEWVCHFDTVVYDPPYRMSGTRDLGEFDHRYGLEGEAPTVNGILELLSVGTARAMQAARPGGTVLVKCQDQVVSGKKCWQTDQVKEIGRRWGTLEDMFTMLTDPRPQPEGRRQLHSRSNYSTLLVFQKNKIRKTKDGKKMEGKMEGEMEGETKDGGER